MLTSAQLETFEERGIVRLQGAFSGDSARAMVERVWEALGRRGVERDAPETWPTGTIDKLQNLKSHQVFDAIGSDVLMSSVDQLLGAGRWRVPKEWGQFLISFPSHAAEATDSSARSEGWTIPHHVWHTDFSFRLPDPPLFGALVFSFLGDVPPGSGGTVVVRSSHHLMRRFVEQRPSCGQEKMKVTREAFLRSDPWLRALASEDEGDAEDRVQQFALRDHTIRGVPVRVVELCGDAGDVILCHPWMLHASADNAGTTPRMMRVQRIHIVRPAPDDAQGREPTGAIPPRS
ncbi:MAG: phytanoyl-CoA dioxygenase family protein [Deltaproteobacteria bacterium]|nr:phytanoyl-CoA dioxygenase family protein [Deltaproteobacteria bacterium]MBW2395435.1 phytanoyl-CoA dioxygenase family protein [Deltaproteobacteria bacterium]